MLVFICAALGAALLAACVGLIAIRTRLGRLRARYASIANADEEAARIVKEALDDAARQHGQIDAERQQAHAEVAAERQRRDTLVQQYATAKKTFDQLYGELRRLEENLEDISFGLYKPHYEFDTPEQFKEVLGKVNEQQKEMVRSGRAAGSAVTWSVGGSEKEGAKMQKQYSKLMLRAFNGECDAAVAKVSWNNVDKMEERIRKAFDAINDLGGVMQVSMDAKYRDLKLAELRLEHELEEKKRAIAEEQRSIREQLREEERAQRDAEKAQSDAEAEESRSQKALDKARAELAKSRGEEHQRLTARMLELEQQLEIAHSKKERAKAMAELTRAGYVYVLSNIGSFGDNVFKIGMTRRLDPMDRVKELGDASVPFPFDVHAMVYSEDAPKLEYSLHQHFAQKSVNLINMKKEFFQVGLDEVEGFANKKGLKMTFTKLAEAREYRETVGRRTSRAGHSGPALAPQVFPENLLLEPASP